MTKALDYITEKLGFIEVDVNFPLGNIGEHDGENYIFVHFKREIIFKWTSGYDVTCLVGHLTKKEENKIYSLDRAEHHIDVEE